MLGLLQTPLQEGKAPLLLFSHHEQRMLGRYGYVERIRQGGEFVAALLDRVISLLLKSLQEQLAESAALRADLSFTDIFPVPVCSLC